LEFKFAFYYYQNRVDYALAYATSHKQNEVA